VSRSNGFKISPRARRILRQSGLDPAGLQGSGPGGRIVEKDVLGHRGSGVAPSGGKRVALTPMRAAIARRLTESKQTVPHFYLKQTIRTDALVAYRKGVKESTGASVNDLVLQATARTLAEFPDFRCRWAGDALEEQDGIHLGVAVGLEEGGVVVPVLLHADRLSLADLHRETVRLAEAARQRRIENMGRGIFTVSNLGMFGVEEFTAIVNPPESGILAVGAIRHVMTDNGPAQVMTVQLSCDHRIVDGVLAARFMNRLKERLENPAVGLGGERSVQVISEPPAHSRNGRPDGKGKEVVVVGAGPGGYVAALEAAHHGAKVTLVEKSPHAGGTCLNFGCIPSKALLASAELRHRLTHARSMGILLPGKSEVDWKAIQNRKNKIVQDLRGGLRHLFQSAEIQTLHGTGRLAGPGLVAVRGTEGEKVLKASQIILAPGSRPTVLPGITVDGERIATTDTALHWDSLPASLLIIGGGVIGVEFACLMQALGVRVTVVEKQERILPEMEADLGKEMFRILARRRDSEMGTQGVEFVLGAEIKEVSLHNREVGVRLAGGKELRAERVLVAVGRRPATEDLGLETANLSTNRGYLLVGDDMRVAPGIFCVGDANGRCQLAQAASAQGKVAARNALGGHETLPGPIPFAVYSFPEIASAGLTEEECRQAGRDFAVGRFPLSNLGKSRVVGETDGFVKVLRATADDTLLGVHAIGHNAVEFITAVLPLLRQGAKAQDLGSIVFPHPSMSEALAEAADDSLGHALHLPKRLASA